MPCDVLWRGNWFAGLRLSHRLPGEPQEQLVYAVAAADVVGDEDSVVRVQSDRASVERLVVEGAEDEAVTSFGLAPFSY